MAEPIALRNPHLLSFPILLNAGASASQTGPSLAEPEVSALRASVPRARPTRRDPAIIRAAAEKLAVACAEWCGASKPEDWVDDLIKCEFYWDDGYRLARALQDRCYVDPDADLVETLSYASSELWDAESVAVRAWIDANNIKPSLKVGDRISYREWVGVVNGIDEQRAIYLLKPDGEEERYLNGGGILVAYELAVPASGIEAATAGETQGGSTEGESPTAEGGDAR